MPADPLIVTLALDRVAQARFDALRTEHFPAERLMVGAHVTLFHALPGENSAAIAPTLAGEARGVAPFQVAVTSVRFLGRGVAYALQSPTLTALRGRFRQYWVGLLTAQDRQPWQPHITIQNKADPGVARALHRQMQDAFVPYQITATGLRLWHYRGGPWEVAGCFEFRPCSDSGAAANPPGF